MASTTVAQFATELKLPPQLLLEQLKAAGVVKKAESDSLTEDDKSRLLESLRKAHGAGDGAAEKTEMGITATPTSRVSQRANATSGRLLTAE